MMLDGFAPWYSTDAKVLVLGSMPGAVSLGAQQYYAHPRNLFWVLICELLGEAVPSRYDKKLELLKRRGIALWDALAQCEREGSLDSSIDAQSETANDFVWLFKQLPKLELVIFNGRKSEQLFKKHCKHLIEGYNIKFYCAPSTSPANAAVSRDEKLRCWKEVIAEVLELRY